MERDAVGRSRSRKPDLKLGICAEHGGQPKSVAFCHELGLDSVSCSPYRVPVARLAAAQAALAASAAEQAVAELEAAAKEKAAKEKANHQEPATVAGD